MNSILRPPLSQAMASVARRRFTGRTLSLPHLYTSSSSHASISYQTPFSSSSAASSSSSSTTSSSSSSATPRTPPQHLRLRKAPPGAEKPRSRSSLLSGPEELPLLTRSQAQRPKNAFSDGARKKRVNTSDSAEERPTQSAWPGVAPETLIEEEEARAFPLISVTSLADRRKSNTFEMTSGKVSIVALLNGKTSEQQTKSFYAPTLKACLLSPTFQLLEVDTRPKVMKRYLVSLFLASLRCQMSEQRQKGYFLTSVNVDEPSTDQGRILMQALGTTSDNDVGYTYLLDRNGKIRWVGRGLSDEGERKALLDCTTYLIGEKGKVV